MLVCTLGDLLLDVVVRLGAPLEAGSDAPAADLALVPEGRPRTSRPGRSRSGARGRLVCRRGGDGAAQLAEEGLAGLGVEIVGPRAGGGGGVVVSLVDPHGDRTMASDRGVSPGLEAADLDPGWLAGADVLHLSGYSLLREPISAAARRAASLARASGTRVSVDLAAAPLITTYGASRFRGELGELGPDVVFATVSEEEALGGPLRGRSGCASAVPQAARSCTARSAWRCRPSRVTSSTRQVPAMRSPPASFSAATSRPRCGAGSRQRRAASRPSARCLLE